MYNRVVVVDVKTRTQIYLDPDQERQLARLAAARRCSRSALVRESIRRYLEDTVAPEEDPAMEIVGLAGEAGRADLSENHDGHLVAAARDGG
jgi:predicted transcriptional regulator